MIHTILYCNGFLYLTSDMLVPLGYEISNICMEDGPSSPEALVTSRINQCLNNTKKIKVIIVFQVII